MKVKLIKTNLGNNVYTSMLGYGIFGEYYKNCEMQTKRWILRNLNSDSIFIDVGANIGILSRTALQIINDGKVIAIEPTKTATILEKNLREFSNVFVIRKAIADFNGKAAVSLEKVYRHEKETRNFEFHTLDSIVSDLAIGKIDLLKIDTDGWEIEVLKGAAESIKRYKPAIIVELNEGLLINQHTIQEVFGFFINNEYTDALICDGSNFIFTANKVSEFKANSYINIKVDTETFPPNYELGEEVDNLKFNIINDSSTLVYNRNKIVSFKDNNPKWSYNCSLLTPDFIDSPLVVKITGAVCLGKLGILATSKDGSVALAEEEIVEKVDQFEVLLFVENWGGRLVFRNAGLGPIEVEIESLSFFKPKPIQPT